MQLKDVLLVVLCAFAVVVSGQASDQIPGKLPDGPIAVVGATIHPVSSAPIENGTLVFENGQIIYVGDNPGVPANAEIVDAAGLHAYPGFIESYSRIGLVEINAVRASNDYAETGALNPNVLAHVSVNPDSELIPVTRSNGVLLAVAAPSSGLISGQCAVMQLDGWTYEEMTLKPHAGMIVSLNNDKDVEKIRELFDDARRYLRAVESDSNPRHDVRLAAMVPVLKGEQPIIVRANRWESISRAVAFAVDEQLQLIIFGGYDAPKCAELLKKHDIPVILSAVHRKPLYRHDPYDAAYTLPKQLLDLEVRFAISGYDRSSSYNVRNLPYHAGTAAAFGLTQEEAIRAITLAPAEILGIADRVGSLEPGKDATFFLTNGNPLEAAANVQQAWIAGRPVDLSDKQKMLYQKYQRKYE